MIEITNKWRRQVVAVFTILSALFLFGCDDGWEPGFNGFFPEPPIENPGDGEPSQPRTLSVAAEYPAGPTDMRFGYPVINVPDLDGDGFEEIAVGANHAFPSGMEKAGRFYVLSGKTGTPLIVLEGENEDDHLGRGIANAGDINNDGFADLMVGAPYYGIDRPGVVYVISGKDGTTLSKIMGPENQGRFGRFLIGGRDVTGDQVNDLVIAAFQEDSPGTDSGAVYIYSGADFPAGPEDSYPVFRKFEGNDGDEFGSAVDIVDDIDEDGVADLLVGARRYHFSEAEIGKAFIYNVITGAEVRTIGAENPEPGDFFGASVAALPDIDADGVGDYAVGADRRERGGTDAGVGFVNVYSGKDGQKIYRLDGETPGGTFGFTIESGGDFNNDGDMDLLVSENRASASDGTEDVGAFYVFSGPTGELLYKQTGESTGERYGTGLSFIQDLNGDGLVDVISGAPGDPDLSFQGLVQVLQ